MPLALPSTPRRAGRPLVVSAVGILPTRAGSRSIERDPASSRFPRARLLTRLILAAVLSLAMGEGLVGCGALPLNKPAASNNASAGFLGADRAAIPPLDLASNDNSPDFKDNSPAPEALDSGRLAPLGFSAAALAELGAPLGFWTREGARLTGDALFAMPELFDSCPTSPRSALRMAGDQREKHAMDAVAWPGASATLANWAAAQTAANDEQRAIAQTSLSDSDALRRASFTASIASPGSLAEPTPALGKLGAKPFRFAPIDAEADGTLAAANEGLSGSSPAPKKASMFEEANLRGATYWQDDGAIPGLRPQLEQAGESLFQPFDSAWPAPSAYSASEAGRVAAIKNAMRAHAQKKPAGWDRLVAQVRETRERDGELAALQLAQAVINEVRYVDGTDGTFYSPAKFFAQSGVCKDYVVAKYILLRESGYPAEKLRIVALAPRFKGDGQAEWHIIIAARADGQVAPLSLSSPPNPDGAGGAPADVHRGPSALLSQILSGAKPASTVLKHPQGPKVSPLADSDQKGRPVAESFTESGFVSFEISPSALRGTGRVALGLVGKSTEAAQLAANARWAQLPAGAYPKWSLRGWGGESALASDDATSLVKRGKKKRGANVAVG